MELLPKTRTFLRDWLDWVERGAPNGEPYWRNVGLCQAAASYGHGFTLIDDLVEFFECCGYSFLYPFNEGRSFLVETAAGTIHLNPRRLAFVREYAAEKEKVND